MRQLQRGQVLNVRAIGGCYVVTLAWDFAEGQDHKRTNLLGFAIERSELKNGNVIERYYLRGIKRFKFKDEGLPPGTPMPTSEHPDPSRRLLAGRYWGAITDISQGCRRPHPKPDSYPRPTPLRTTRL